MTKRFTGTEKRLIWISLHNDNIPQLKRFACGINLGLVSEAVFRFLLTLNFAQGLCEKFLFNTSISFCVSYIRRNITK